MPSYVLSERDRAILDALIREVESGRVNIPIRPPSGWSQVEGHQAPEVYLAKPQSANGIPALSPDDPDVPGTDVCDFYGINTDGEIAEIASLSRTVFNLTNEAVQQDWLLVVRTKQGKWIAVATARQFDRCNALLTASISGSGDVTVDNVVATMGVSPLSDPDDTAETLVVKNSMFQFTGDSGGNCKIEYNHTTGEWELYQVKCPA